MIQPWKPQPGSASPSVLPWVLWVEGSCAGALPTGTGWPRLGEDGRCSWTQPAHAHSGSGESNFIKTSLACLQPLHSACGQRTGLVLDTHLVPSCGLWTGRACPHSSARTWWLPPTSQSFPITSPYLSAVWYPSRQGIRHPQAPPLPACHSPNVAQDGSRWAPGCYEVGPEHSFAS